MTPAEVLKFAQKNGVKIVDFKFVDLLGQWQHTSMPLHKLQEDSFSEGFGFDGSSIRGWKAINESDMVFIPDEHRRLTTRLNGCHLIAEFGAVRILRVK